MMRHEKNKTNPKLQIRVHFLTPTHFPLPSSSTGPWTRLLLPTATGHVSAPNWYQKSTKEREMIQGNLGRGGWGSLRARKNETTHVFNIMSGHGTPNGTTYLHQIKFKKLERNFFLKLSVLCFYLYELTI